MWCGVVWCGVVWCGVVWCGVVEWGSWRVCIFHNQKMHFYLHCLLFKQSILQLQKYHSFNQKTLLILKNTNSNTEHIHCMNMCITQVSRHPLSAAPAVSFVPLLISSSEQPWICSPVTSENISVQSPLDLWTYSCKVGQLVANQQERYEKDWPEPKIPFNQTQVSTPTINFYQGELNMGLIPE